MANILENIEQTGVSPTSWKTVDDVDSFVTEQADIFGAKTLSSVRTREAGFTVVWKVMQEKTSSFKMIACYAIRFNGKNQASRFTLYNGVEFSGLNFLSCPIEFFGLVPVVHNDWRMRVLQYHRDRGERRSTFTVGTELRFKSGIKVGDALLDGKVGRIESLRPLTATVLMDDGTEQTVAVSRRFFLLDGESEGQVETVSEPVVTDTESESEIEAESEAQQTGETAQYA